MKLQESKFESTIMGAEKEMTFSIESENSVIFDILRDKMYSNKIAAVCREVSSNCRDANRENNSGDKSIKIIIAEPNEYLSITDMAIVFQDSGVGITPDRMESIFLKYGASTKRDTNSQTGGFGLGAKTPFAYNDTFTVITVCDDSNGVRKEYTYNAMIDSTRKGKMVLFDSETTDKETGTKIIVPIQESDRDSFERECYKATCLWDTKPEYLNFNVYEPEFVNVLEDSEEIKDIYIKKEEGSTSILNGMNKGFVLLIDGIPYPIKDMSLIGTYILPVDGICFIPFKNGELTIAANRETVQYDEETVKLIRKKLSSLKKVLVDQINKYFDDNFSTFVKTCVEWRSFCDANENSWNKSSRAIINTLASISNGNDVNLKKIVDSKWNFVRNKFLLKVNKNISFKFFELKRISKEWSGQDKLDYVATKSIDSKWDNSTFYIKESRRNIKKKSLQALKLNEANSGTAYTLTPTRIIELLNDTEMDKFIKELHAISSCLKTEFYDDLKHFKAESTNSIESKETNSYKKGKYDNININTREFSFNSFNIGTLHYSKEHKQVIIPVIKELKNLCFVTVDKLSNYKEELGKETLLKINFLNKLCDVKTIVVKNSAWKKYFEKDNFPKLEELYSKHKKSLKKELLKSNRQGALSQINLHINSTLVKHFKDYIPKEWADAHNGKYPMIDLYSDQKDLSNLLNVDIIDLNEVEDKFIEDYKQWKSENILITIILKKYRNNIADYFEDKESLKRWSPKSIPEIEELLNLLNYKKIIKKDKLFKINPRLAIIKSRMVG